MKSVASLSVLAAIFAAGCANDGIEFGEEVGGTWGTGPWELPPQVKQSFVRTYPGATVAAWDRHNYEGGESVYDIVYHDPAGLSHSVRLSALGDVLPQTTPQEQTQQQFTVHPTSTGQAAEQQADVNEAR
jgi:hypothetical protein